MEFLGDELNICSWIVEYLTQKLEGDQHFVQESVLCDKFVYVLIIEFIFISLNNKKITTSPLQFKLPLVPHECFAIAADE